MPSFSVILPRLCLLRSLLLSSVLLVSCLSLLLWVSYHIFSSLPLLIFRVPIKILPLFLAPFRHILLCPPPSSISTFPSTPSLPLLLVSFSLCLSCALFRFCVSTGLIWIGIVPLSLLLLFSIFLPSTVCFSRAMNVGLRVFSVSMLSFHIYHRPSKCFHYRTILPLLFVIYFQSSFSFLLYNIWTFHTTTVLPHLASLLLLDLTENELTDKCLSSLTDAFRNLPHFREFESSVDSNNEFDSDTAAVKEMNATLPHIIFIF